MEVKTKEMYKGVPRVKKNVYLYYLLWLFFMDTTYVHLGSQSEKIFSNGPPRWTR